MQPQRHRHLDLHANAAAPTITDVFRIGCRELVPPQPGIDTEIGDGSRHSGLQGLIEAPNERLLHLATTSVYRDHMIAAGQQVQTSRLIKPVAGQVERGIVAGMANSFEQVEIEIRPCNVACNVRCVLLDGASMGAITATVESAFVRTWIR